MTTSTDHICVPPHGAGSPSLLKPAPWWRAPWSVVPAAGLAGETVAVTAGTFAALRLLNEPGAPGLQWLAVPGLLVTAALVPTWLARREFPRFGLDRQHARGALWAVGGASLAVLPALVPGLWLLSLLHLPLPLRPVAAQRPNWPAWLLYQFLYVAVAEEVFFRGYIQANTARLLARARWLCGPRQHYATLLISAGCFALAHVVVQGRVSAALVFLPGLILAWLFARTGTLLSPILFHGLANVSYALMVARFA
jgi:membrane protease YdiL (CAAX protease family)